MNNNLPNHNLGAIQVNNGNNGNNGNNRNNRRNRNNGRNGNRNRNNLPNHNLGAIQVNEPQPVPERTNEQIKTILETPRKQPFVMIPNAVKQFENALQETLGESMTHAAFSALLIKYNAIVSGSFMLYALGIIRRSNDIDIYVNCKHLKEFRNEFLANFTLISRREYVASTYCVSFMRKNGIRSIQSFISGYHAFDVIGVRNKRKPSDVVQNFDLTFCQVWYDGRMVYATHPAHVFAKVGYLQKEYIPTFLQGNKFLQNRIEKYSKRGFMVTLDPTGLEEQLVALQENPVLCTKPDKQLKIKLDGKNVSVANDWAFRAILEFIMTGKYSLKTYSSNNKITTLPIKYRGIDVHKSYIDGYDSDDYDPPDYENIFAVANEKAISIDPTLADNTPEECFYHLASRLIENMMSQTIEKNPYLQQITRDTRVGGDALRKWAKDLTDLSDNYAAIQYWIPYVRALQTFAKREGEDFTTNEGQLYDFHNHPLNAGIIKDTLEGYIREKLESHVIKNPNQIPCFWQHSGCTQFLTLDQLRPIISDELRHTLEAVEDETPNPSIFNSTVTRGTDILQNTKSSTDAWGAIYHQSVCPFCMVSVDRTSGCAYMNHGTSTLLDTRSVDDNKIYTPGCQKSEFVDEIRDKYIIAINTLETNGTLVLDDPDYGYHLEFCVECGRPCVNHQHFTAFADGQAPGIEPPRVMAGGVPDYGKCDGGGRAEMFARVLAIREVLRTYTGSNKKEQRRLAALAADAAPRDAALMTRAAVIEAAAPTDRAWGNAQPINHFNTNILANNNMNSVSSDGSNNTSVNSINNYNDMIEEDIQQLRNVYESLFIELQDELNNNLHTKEYYLEKIQQYEYEIDGNLNEFHNIQNLSEESRDLIRVYEHDVEEQITTLRAEVAQKFPVNAVNEDNQAGGSRKKHTRKQRGAKQQIQRKKYRHSTHKLKRTK